MVRAISQDRTITAEVTGTDRYKYFRRPVTEAKDGSPSETTTRFPLLGLENVTSLGLLAPPTTAQKPPTRYAATQVRATQTDYRESEAQTKPWTPPYTTHGDSTPEVLYLDRLSWGNGLPPGKHEVDIVERLRRKRAWESQLPPPDCQENINIRYKLIAEMEKSDWQFREKEIEAVHKERMKKSEQLLEEHSLMNRSRLTSRMEFLEDDITKRKEHKLQLIRHDKERALRKLCMREKGYDPKKYKMSVLEEHLWHTSELYAPMTRNGISLKNRNETLAQKQFTIDDGDICEFAYAPTYRPVFDFNKASQPKRQTELCVRETRWTLDNLVKLHQDLQKLRDKSSKADAFYAQVEQRPKPSFRVDALTLPCAQRPMMEESLYQAAITIQRVVHSRSMQALMEQKRECWKELMQELKTSRLGHSLPDITNARDECILQARMAGVLDNLIGLNVGTSIGQTLYLLATELLRFKNEGIAHSQALLAEAARWRRELPEEGRRQREMRRREEHNLMFAQLLEVYQDSINEFVGRLVSQAIENEAKLQAYDYGKEVARLAELERLERVGQQPEPEELVSADLLFELIAPEGLRELARTCLLILKQKYQEARKCLVELGQAEQLQESSRKPTEVLEGAENIMEQVDHPDEEDTSVVERARLSKRLSEQTKGSVVTEQTVSVESQSREPTRLSKRLSEQTKGSVVTEQTVSVESQSREPTRLSKRLSEQTKGSVVTEQTVSVESQSREPTRLSKPLSEQTKGSVVTEQTVSVESQSREPTRLSKPLSEQTKGSVVTEQTVSVESQSREPTRLSKRLSEQMKGSVVTEQTVSVESQSREPTRLSKPLSEQTKGSVVTEQTVSMESQSREPTRLGKPLSEQTKGSVVTEQTVSMESQSREPTRLSKRLSEQMKGSVVTPTVSMESQSREPTRLLLIDGMEPLELMGSVSTGATSSLASGGASSLYSEVSEMMSSLMTPSQSGLVAQCRKFDLQGVPEPRSVEDRLLVRVMRDMCCVAGSLLHTAAKILNKAIQLAGIPQESFDEALRRTMLVINGALEEVIGLILPKKPEEKQPISEELLIEASKIVDEILQKAKQRISEMKEEDRIKMASTDAESCAKALIEDVIKEAEQKVLRMIVEDFLSDLIDGATNQVDGTSGN